MNNKIHVAILDDHPMMIEGYETNLKDDARIEVVAKGNYGEDLDGMLDSCNIDLLILDVSVPTSKENRNPYPIHHVIPKMLLRCPDLTIVVVSMYDHRTLIRSLLDAGAYGFILKDDHESFNKLGDILVSVCDGDIYLSESTHQILKGPKPKKPSIGRRQREILSLCLSSPGIKTIEIAKKLQVAHSTVRNQLSYIYLSLGVNNRYEAISKARKLGLLPPESQFSSDPAQGGENV